MALVDGVIEVGFHEHHVVQLQSERCLFVMLFRSTENLGSR